MSGNPNRAMIGNNDLEVKQRLLEQSEQSRTHDESNRHKNGKLKQLELTQENLFLSKIESNSGSGHHSRIKNHNNNYRYLKGRKDISNVLRQRGYSSNMNVIGNTNDGMADSIRSKGSKGSSSNSSRSVDSHNQRQSQNRHPYHQSSERLLSHEQRKNMINNTTTDNNNVSKNERDERIRASNMTHNLADILNDINDIEQEDPYGKKRRR